MTDKVYCYPPDYTFLENKLGIRDAGKFELSEREFVTERIAQGVDHEIANLVFTDDADSHHLCAWIGQVDGGPGGS